MVQEKAEPIKCSKKAQFRTGPCECDNCMSEATTEQQQREALGVIITDHELLKKELITWTGFVYFCKNCKKPGIMNPMNHCGVCGVKVTINSKVLTDFLNDNGI